MQSDDEMQDSLRYNTEHLYDVAGSYSRWKENEKITKVGRRFLPSCGSKCEM